MRRDKTSVQTQLNRVVNVSIPQKNDPPLPPTPALSRTETPPGPRSLPLAFGSTGTPTCKTHGSKTSVLAICVVNRSCAPLHRYAVRRHAVTPIRRCADTPLRR